MNIAIERTTDEAYIKSVLLNPTIYAGIKDDSCPMDSKDLPHGYAFRIPGFFLRLLLDSKPAGVFWLIWKGESVEAHTLLDGCRGRAAIDATRQAITWVFANTSAKAITSYAWSDSPAVAWFCRAVGMEMDRTEPWPTTRSGKSVDISHFTISRPKESA